MSGTSRLIHGLCLTCALAPALAVSGGTLPITDLSMSAAVSPEQPLYPPGTVAQVEYTVHNAGPDDAPGASIGAGVFAFQGPNSQVTLVPPDQVEPCGYGIQDLGGAPYFHGHIVFTLTFPPIAAGTSVTCRLRMEVLDTARGTFESQVRANPLFASDTSTDPNPDNDIVMLSVPLTDAPPPATDLALSLDLVPAQPIYPPGSEVRLRVTARNNGPEATGGSRVTFDPTWVTDPNAPAAIMPVPLGDVPRECLASLVESQTSVGFTVSYLQLRALDVGESLTCEYRFLVLADAPTAFGANAISTPVPDFGDPTADPVPGNDAATLMVQTAQGGIVASPSVVPTLNAALLVFLAAAIAVGTWLFGGSRP